MIVLYQHEAGLMKLDTPKKLACPELLDLAGGRPALLGSRCRACGTRGGSRATACSCGGVTRGYRTYSGRDHPAL